MYRVCEETGGRQDILGIKLDFSNGNCHYCLVSLFKQGERGDTGNPGAPGAPGSDVCKLSSSLKLLL